jgi:hypothetical protein
VDVVEQHSQTGDSATPSAPLDETTDGGLVQQPEYLGLGYRSTQIFDWHDCRKVEQRSRHGRAGNAMEDGSIGVRERPVPVRGDAAWNTPATVRGHDVDRWTPVVPQPPQRSGRSVRENGAVAAGKDRRHAPSVQGERSIADHVHTLMNSAQSFDLDPSLHAALKKPQSAKLVDGHDPVLSSGKAVDSAIDLARRPSTGRFPSFRVVF